MSYEEQALRQANDLTDEELHNFLVEVEKIPSHRSPITGEIARLCFEFMEDTGLRATETIHVRKKDIDFSTRILTVTHPKTETRCKCSVWRNRDAYSRFRILESADPTCKSCHGKGTWKKAQFTTVTPRIVSKLWKYCITLSDNEKLFPVSRQSLWNWAKEAGRRAGINIFQKKQERIIKGMFVHFFRALCSKRVKIDAKDDKYRDELLQCKRRDSYDIMADRYTAIDINYLLTWEERTYGKLTMNDSITES